jgi:hypothetical protein
MFIAALFTIAKLWKQPRCPTTDEWTKKLCGKKKNYIYIYMYSIYVPKGTMKPCGLKVNGCN